MKIDFVIGQLLPNSGGGERVLRDVAVELARRGHDVRVLSYSPNLSGTGYYQYSADVQHINVSNMSKGIGSRFKKRIAKSIPSKKKPLFGERLQEILFFWRQDHFFSGLISFWKSSPPDIVIGFMGNGVCISSLAVSKLGIDVPFFASLHASPFRLFSGKDVKSRLTQNAISRATRVGFPLDEHERGIEGVHGAQFVALPNPVDIPDNVSIHEREKNIIAVGRLVGLKRIDKLLLAWGKIHNDFPDWKIELLGTGPELSELQKQACALGIAEKVVFRGDVIEIFTEYEKASLLVHPSKFEGFGLVIAEALGRGVPVIGFDGVPGVQSLVFSGVNGILAQPNGDTDSLANAIRSLLSDPDRLQELSLNARATVEKYKLENSVDVWEREILTAANDV